MAALGPELLVLSDAGRFRADNLLGAEDWDAALYGCHDDRLEPPPLFPSLDPDPMFDGAFEEGGAGGGGGAVSPPDPPWDQEPPGIFLALQVKSEPGSPTSSHCSESSSSSSSSSEPPPWGPNPPEMGVKMEPPPPPLPQDPGKGSRAVKAEGAPLPPPRRTPPIQPKPPGGGGGAAGSGGVPKTPTSPPQTILLQPLPPAPPLPAAITVPPPAVLLSPGELLLPGVLCLPPPHTQGPPRTPPNGAPPKPETKTIVPAPTPNPSGPPEVDLKVLKRQQRMIKNRESASQSRRRRKEYVLGLELRLREALEDNERLRRENGALRGHLQTLLAQSSELRPGPRRLACLAALLLLLAFNLGSLSLSQSPLPPAEPPRTPPVSPPLPPSRGRRHLLGVPEGGATPTPPPQNLNDSHAIPPPTRMWGPPLGPRKEEETPRNSFRNSSLGGGALGGLQGLFQGPDCRRFNRTESLRLADELSGWVRRHQSDRGKPGTPPRTPRNQFQSLPPWKAPPRLVPAASPHPERPPPGQQLQLYSPDPQVLAAIARRDDTFYVVSFRRDHLLLPARAHNKTSRPKMSVVMPAAALNESLRGGGAGLEAMMQVDCEVMDTRVIHVRRRPPTHAPPPPQPRHKPRPPG